MMMPLRFFIEVILALLGGFILWLALVTHKYPDRHSQSWLIVSVVLMVWGAFAVLRARGLRTYLVDRVGGFSLILVGGLMLVISRAPFAWVMPLFAATGGLLVLRGLVGCVLVSRRF
jgi:hypothetical protein